MLPPHLHLRRRPPSLAQTPEIASHLGTGVGRVAALTNAAGAIDLQEIARSREATAVARGLPLDLDVPRGIDILETPHPGGETEPIPTTNDLLCEGFIFPVDFRPKDI